VFDLLQAPPPFSSSTRIRAQQACLMYADAAVSGGDLAEFYVPGTPLRVAWPLVGCEEVTRSTNGMFPPAPEDDWYARFVAVPLGPDLDSSTERTVFDHPIDVTLYRPDGAGPAEDQRLLEDLTYRFVVARPPLFHAASAVARDPPAVLRDQRLRERFASATPLLVEGPLMTALPPIEQVNMGLAGMFLSDRAPSRELGARGPAGDVDLTNVFIEVSPLDAHGWERIEHDREIEVVEGIWLQRSGERFHLTVFMDVPSGAPYSIGPIEIVSDAGSRSFVMRGTEPGASWVPLAGIDLLARCFVKALLLVRSLSPRWKLSAYPVAQMDGQGSRWVSYGRLEWALGELVSLRELSGPIASYYAMRHWDSDEPFYGEVGMESPAVGGHIRMEGQRYEEIDPSELLEPVGAELGRPPPTL